MKIMFTIIVNQSLFRTKNQYIIDKFFNSFRLILSLINHNKSTLLRIPGI